VHADGFRPMLFDLENDPGELVDLGADPSLGGVRARLLDALNLWGRRQSQRTALSEEQILAMRGASLRRGILLGFWDEAELPDEMLHEKWRGARRVLDKR
jgi:hypothetical protein